MEQIAQFKDTDFLTIEEKGGWPYDYTSTRGLWPYIKRQGSDLVGIEIGTSCAESTVLLLEKCQNIKTLTTIDPYKPFLDWNGQVTQEVLDRQKDVAKRNLAQFGDRVKIVNLESAKAVKQFKPESVDFIFVDGDHSYGGVIQDCELFYPLLKKGGFFCGHDYTFLEPVRNAVNDFRKNHKISSPLQLTSNSAFFWYK